MFSSYFLHYYRVATGILLYISPIVLVAFVKKKLFFIYFHLILFCPAQVIVGLLHSTFMLTCNIYELTLQRYLKRYAYANMKIRSYLCLFDIGITRDYIF